MRISFFSDRKKYNVKIGHRWNGLNGLEQINSFYFVLCKNKSQRDGIY